MSVFQGSLAGVRSRQSLRQSEQRLLLFLLILTDAATIAASFALAYAVRFWFARDIFNEGSMRPLFYATVTGLLIPGYLVLYYVHGLYDRTNLLGGTTEYARVFNAVTSGLVLLLLINFVQPEFVVARAWLLLAWALTVILCVCSRFLVRRYVYWQRHFGRFVDRTLVVGANPEGLAIAEQLIQARSSGALVVGFVDDYLPAGSQPIDGVAVLGSSSVFATLVAMQEIDIVVIANTAITRERLLGLYSGLEALRDVEVRLASGLFELLTTSVRIREEGLVPLMVLNKTRITGPHLFCKTLLDYGLATLALLLLWPLFVAIALWVTRDSPGPAFYRRRVVGQGKLEFDAFKFRTMYTDGDARLDDAQRLELAQQGKLKDDPRMTRAGVFLRRYSLDELPQLVNVLRGEMSLIGPRMITRAELEKFGRWQYNRATVKPGLTGLWQISGRSDLSYEDRVRLDMHYIRNHSIWLDIHILIRTIPALLSGRGAY
jgi:exopolysaccharide biosynthesis polyprenyl glycosylphosphotransferase